MAKKLRHKICKGHVGFWSKDKNQIKEVDWAAATTDEELFIGAAFFSDVPRTKEIINRAEMTL